MWSGQISESEFLDQIIVLIGNVEDVAELDPPPGEEEIEYETAINNEGESC